MHSLRTAELLKVICWIALGMIVIVVFHIGGSFAHLVGQFSPLIGACVGAGVTLWSALTPRKINEQTDAWIGFEKWSWLLIGCGIAAWGIGESFWRHYIAIGETPFPSLADAGYSLFPLFAFVGLLLQPLPKTRSKRLVLLLDCLISMGSIFAIAWYLLLGSLAQAPGEPNLAKFLGLYYPVSDTALLSCIIFLLLRGQGYIYQSTARRSGLLILGVGICFFVFSDFLFNIQNNAGTYIEATWIDLGWPLGLMTMGVAAYLRRFLPATSEAVIQHRLLQRREEMNLSPAQFVPYALLGLLLLTLFLAMVVSPIGQQTIRVVLLSATLIVVVLVVTRQILTLLENVRLNQKQTASLHDLELANQRVEQQSRQMAEHAAELEFGIAHLKDVHANLANGNMRTRARLTHGALLPLAGSINLLAERFVRLNQNTAYAQHVLKALSELSRAIERTSLGESLQIPESCRDLTEINRLLVALRMKRFTISDQLHQSFPQVPVHQQPATQPLTGEAPMVRQREQGVSQPSLHSSGEQHEERRRVYGARPTPYHSISADVRREQW